MSGCVDKSQAPRWQNGIDIPEGVSLTEHTSGITIRPRQASGGSVPPTQSIL